MHMELKLLGINNFDKYKNPLILQREATKNYNDFNQSIDILKNLGSNENMITNIQHMKNKINDMVSSGRVTNDGFEHKMLETTLNQAVEIQLKTKKSMDDIADFYHTYNNFQDISKRLGGDS